jgi:myo-inositol-1(or 4)-monophosphatase
MQRDDRELAAAAVTAGAAVVLQRFGGGLARIDKGGGDFATEADLAAEQAILGVLRAARPDDAVLGEESGHSGGTGDGRLWLVDPLCGTLNYATGGMAVAVNVALRDGGAITTAAVADPFSGEVFWTGGDGAFVRRDGTDERLRPVADPPLVDVNLDPPLDDGTGARLLAHPEFRRLFRPRVLSTTLALTWVAAGRRVAYVTAGDVSGSVHFAAGIALCQAAGCVVTGLDGGPPGAGGLLAAADRASHDRLRSILTDVDISAGTG